MVGGAAGGVRVVSLSKGEIIATLGGHTEGESIEAVTFVDLSGGSNSGPGVAVTGATDGKACIWDLSTMRLRASVNHEVEISAYGLLQPTDSYSIGCNNRLIQSSSSKIAFSHLFVGR